MIGPKGSLIVLKENQHCMINELESIMIEIYATMIPNWNLLSLQEKLYKGKEVQRRWQNLRTCFKREIRHQKIARAGQGPMKRRKYMYYNRLLFLLPSIEDRETVDEILTVNSTQKFDQSLEEQDEDFIEDRNQIENNLEDDESLQQKNQNSEKTEQFPKQQNTFLGELLNLLKDDNTEEIDEDKSFLLSLVPSLKRFNENEKLEVKIEFLEIIRRIQSRHSPVC